MHIYKKVGRKRTLLPFLLCSLLGVGCLPQGMSIVSKTEEMMGTLATIQVSCRDSEKGIEAIREALKEMRRVESLFSLWIQESEVCRMNELAWKEPVKPSPDMLDLLKISLRISEETEGAFDITIMPLAMLWKENIRKGRIPSGVEIQLLRDFVGFRNIRLDDQERVTLLKKGIKLDFGGIAKGYAVDRATLLLREKGFENFIVQVSGDMVVSGLNRDRKWKIGIQHPRLEGEILQTLKVRNLAVSTSGDYEQYLDTEKRRYHHILDPRTGYPARLCVSVTVLASTCTMADAYATSIFVLGPDLGKEFIRKHPDISKVIMVIRSKDGLKEIEFGN